MRPTGNNTGAVRASSPGRYHLVRTALPTTWTAATSKRYSPVVTEDSDSIGQLNPGVIERRPNRSGLHSGKDQIYASTSWPFPCAP